MKGLGGLPVCTTETHSVLVLQTYSEVEMASQDKETLHTYLRRHFDKVSRANAKQFAEMMENLKGVSGILASHGNTK
jgi:hypothetical protein